MKSTIILAAFSLMVFSACNSEKENDVMDTPIIEQQESSLSLNGEDPVATMQLNGEEPQTNSLEQSVQTAAPKAGTPTSTAGLNPEHGLPGHRCDIAVGAPLSSAPAATPPSATQIAPQGAPQQVQMNQMAAPTATPVMGGQPQGSGKMNPAHGEPGHRCDIQVGAPLN